ncbi:MAG TPA: hypothetical protein P5570_01370 [Candidatus Paceibacterota bacterium]|nr:hypothetical protein [Candidatus Paceibacterota bacterium]
MNTIFICQLILIVAFVGIVFIFLRNFPLLVEFEPRPVPKEKRISYKIKNNWNNFQKTIGNNFSHWQEKTLRRTKVWMLKIDNSITSHLDSIRKQKIHFSKKQKESKSNKKK